MEYNIINAGGAYQTFLVQLKNNVFNFMDYGGYEDRNESTIKLIIDGLKSNEELFHNKELEILINTSDQMHENSFSYAHPTNKYKTIPCFNFDGWRQVGINGFENTVNQIKIEANKIPKSNKVFWSGSIGPHIPPRMVYKRIADQYPNLLSCNSIDFIRDNPEKLTAHNFLSLPEHCNYKYLIDLEGVGYSGRLKFLCFTKRVLFINDRPYKEFWMDGLKDGENCIIVKRDLSNLIEKVEYMESNPELYDVLSKNLYSFAEKTLTKENVNNHIVEVFRRIIK